MSEFYVGQLVRFGYVREGRERPLGRVVKVNRVNVIICSEEAHSTARRERAAGTRWNVAKSLVIPANVESFEGVGSHVYADRDLDFPGYHAHTRYLFGCTLNQSGRERDIQRKKLYASENSLTEGRRFETLGDMRIYLHDLLESPWFLGYYGYLDVTLEASEGKHYSYCSGTLIRLIRVDYTERMLLHELAHAITPDPHGGHGPFYAQCYLTLVRHQMGASAAKAQELSYKKHRVVYSLP
jgi:hypothetical protein